jgi:endo-1,4-beta-xylanase
MKYDLIQRMHLKLRFAYMNKNLSIILFFIIMPITLCHTNCKENKEEKTLKGALKDMFLIGVAMDSSQIVEKDSLGLAIIKNHFNSIVAENCMKSAVIQPEEGKFDFTLADKFVEFGTKNSMFIIGHCLIWHSQSPKWFFVDRNGKDVSREELIQRMKNHIQTLVGRYKGKVNGWDVVNEAFEDDGSWRKSKFYEIIGEDYIKLAFQFAKEADPKAELYYNDFNMAKPGRRETVVKVLGKLMKDGVAIDGIGMQGHITMDYPLLKDEEESIVAYGKLGVKVMITELDLTTIPFPLEQVTADVAASGTYKKQFDPYANGLPDSAARKIHDRYLSFFKLFMKHKDVIGRVTLWGVQDGQSWKNYWPIKGRTDFPLLFDRNYQPKAIVNSIIEEAQLEN